MRALPLSVLGAEAHALELRTSSGWLRRTTELRLSGGACTGRSEDVTYERGDHEAWSGGLAGLEFEGSLGGFIDGIGERLGSALPPAERPASAAYRSWALEATALDLALRQADATLAEVLGLEPRPLRYVLSSSLAGSAGVPSLRALIERWPWIEFKLDASAGWSVDLVDELAALGRVRTVDWKAAYDVDFGQSVAALDVLAAVLQRTDWIVEDPPLEPATFELLREHPGRIAWDAPLHTVADIGRGGFTPGHLNLKPSRIGSLKGLLELAAAGRARGLGLYLGGQFELGPGRLQLQEIGRLLSPEGPNDASPVAFHAPEPELAPELASPLPLPERRAGFGA